MSAAIRRASLTTMLALLPAFAVASRPHVRAGGSIHTARARTTWDSVFTAEQATRGQTAYNQTCARCHQPALGGADESPALTGSTFLGGWNGQTLGDLHARVRTTMPPDDPGSYGRQHIADVIAYVLSVNGFPAGRAELPADDDLLKGIQFLSKHP